MKAYGWGKTNFWLQFKEPNNVKKAKTVSIEFVATIRFARLICMQCMLVIKKKKV